MDRIDIYIRQNIGFEKEKNSFINTKEKMLNSFKNTNSILKLFFLLIKYKRLFKKIPIDKPKDCLKVGIIGELYTAMEPFSTYELEKTLASMNICVTRFTDLSYLLWQKRFCTKHILRVSKKYCKYELGADGLDNVYRTIKLARKNYDGIIHTKPFGCTPEVAAISIITKVCEDEDIPIIFFSFDSQDSLAGVKTRLEAFHDLIKFRRNKND
jgi:predicted nucleotide-binding protein (sugar kinase/HSP70/actin superfamily)